MNGHVVSKRSRRVRYHFVPPQKVALTQFDRNRAFVIGIVMLFAVFALSFSSFFSTNLVGYATVETADKYSVSVSPDKDGKNIDVSLNVNNKKVSSIYLELLYTSEDKKTHLCSNSNLATIVKKDTNLGWNNFRDVQCTNFLQFADATLNIETAKTGEFKVFTFPSTGLPSKGAFKLYIPKLDAYDFATGKDLYDGVPFEFMISLEKGTCGDGACGLGEDVKSCAKDCVKEIKAMCGNGICETGETASTCPADCKDNKGVTSSTLSSSSSSSSSSGSSGGGGGGSGGSGGGGGCVAQWSCGNWGVCNITRQQSRTCMDIGKQCINKKPKVEVQSCVCQESWQCSVWSSCVNGQNTRTCVDENKCGTKVSKPVESKGCNEQIPNYVPPQQTYQPPQSSQTYSQYVPETSQVTQAIEQKPETTLWEQYKEWIVGIPMLLLFVTILIITILHFTKRHPQVTFNYDELKDWIVKERVTGTSDADIELILAQNTGWTKEEVEKILAEMAAGQKVNVPKTAS